MRNTEETSELIRSLLASQRFGVMAAQSEGQPYSNLSAIYLSKHPQLEDFLRKPSNALMKAAVTDYIAAGFESARHLHTG